MKEVFEKLKAKWGITSNWDYLIFLAFLGLAVYLFNKLKNFLFSYFEVSPPAPIYLHLIYWIFALTAIYYLSLYTQKLKSKWGISSNIDFAIICLVFGLTGMTATRLRAFIFPLIGIDESFPLYQRIIFSILMITPSYYVFLLIYGRIFGKYPFFYAMFKKSIGRFVKPFKSSK